MKKVLNIFFYLLLSSPILSYYTVKYRGYQANYYFALATTVIGVVWIIQNFKYFKVPKYIYPLILYIIYLAVWATQNGVIDRRGWFNYLFNNINIQILLILVIIHNTQFTELFIKRSMILIKITIVVAFVFSLVQLVYNPFFFTPQEIIDRTYMASMYQVRRTSVFGYVDANAVGLVFLPLVAIYLGYHLYYKKNNYLILLFMAGIIAIATNTRYVIAGFAMFGVLILISKKVTIVNILQWVVVGGITSVILIEVFKYLGYDFVEFYNQRLFGEGSLEGTTRYLAFTVFMKFFPEYWLVGTGVHLSTAIAGEIGGRSSQIHIGYLAHLVSFGIIGSTFLFSFWIMLARDLYKTAKKTSFYGAFFAFLIFMWANMTLVFYSIFTYGLIFAFIYAQYFKQIDELEEEKDSMLAEEEEEGG